MRGQIKDLAEIVVPKIVDLEMSGEFYITAIKDFLKAHGQIKLRPKPVRHTLDSSVQQRLMDCLSRLLSLDVEYTPCVAVVIYKGKLIVSSNSPKDKTTEEMLEQFLTKKMSLIQHFLLEVTKDIPLGKQPDINKIRFSPRTKLLATKTVLQIIKPENGGVGEVMPSKEHRHKKRNTEIDHLTNALLKLARPVFYPCIARVKKDFIAMS